MALYKDRLILKYADSVWPISPWDTYFYWNKFAKNFKELKKVIYVPYFYPDRLEEYIIPEIKQKSNKLVCLGMANQRSVMLESSLNTFSKMVDTLSSDSETLKEWKFCYTGSEPQSFQMSSRIESLGTLYNPFDAISDAKGIIIPSDLGRGFKTKILEAIICNVYVILPEKVYSRLPIEILPYCISLPNYESHNFILALEKLNKPFPEKININSYMRKLAYRNMTEFCHKEAGIV
jgi:glycosyltransferase involved in cell wall biosynthesis